MSVNVLRPASRAAIVGLAVWSLLGSCAPPAEAKVTRIVIDEKQSPAYEGQSFGGAGPYERITGRAFGEIDPVGPRNAIIRPSPPPLGWGGYPRRDWHPGETTSQAPPPITRSNGGKSR